LGGDLLGKPRGSAVRNPFNWFTSNYAGRPVLIVRGISIHPSMSGAFYVYAVCRTTPTALAASAGDVPASVVFLARTRLRVARPSWRRTDPLIKWLTV
jgi:hypothetical protein